MFSVPGFSELLSPMESILNRDYPTGLLSLNVETNTSNGMKFAFKGSKKNGEKTINSGLTLSYSDKKKGLTLNNVWNQSDEANCQVTINNAFIPKLKVDLSGSVTPNTVISKLKLGAQYKHPALVVSSYLCKPSLCSIEIDTDVVAGKNGFLGGALLKYAIDESRIKSMKLIGGFISPEFAILLQSEGTADRCNLHGVHRVNNFVNVAWKGYNIFTSNEKAQFEFGTTYIIDPATTLKAKIDSMGTLALALSVIVNQSLKATIGGSFSTKAIDDVPKFGASFTLKA